MKCNKKFKLLNLFQGNVVPVLVMDVEKLQFLAVHKELELETNFVSPYEPADRPSLLGGKPKLQIITASPSKLNLKQGAKNEPIFS